MKNECIQEGRIDQIEKNLNSLKKTVMGNGRNDDIKTVVSGFAKFQTEIETEKAVMDKSREVKQWRVRTLVAVAFGVAGVIFTIIQLII